MKYISMTFITMIAFLTVIVDAQAAPMKLVYQTTGDTITLPKNANCTYDPFSGYYECGPQPQILYMRVAARIQHPADLKVIMYREADVWDTELGYFPLQDHTYGNDVGSGNLNCSGTLQRWDRVQDITYGEIPFTQHAGWGKYRHGTYTLRTSNGTVNPPTDALKCFRIELVIDAPVLVRKDSKPRRIGPLRVRKWYGWGNAKTVGIVRSRGRTVRVKMDTRRKCGRVYQYRRMVIGSKKYKRTCTGKWRKR